MSAQQISSAASDPTTNDHVAPTSTPKDVEINHEATLANSSATGSQNKPGTRRKPLRKRSKVWDHLTSFIDDEGKPKARCNYCKKEYCSDTNKNGTSSLKTHISVCKDFTCNKDSTQAQINFNIGENDNGGSLKNWKFDVNEIRKAMSYYFILDELPFKSIEGVGFKNLLSVAFGPQFRRPSRFTIQRDCYEIFLEEKAKLKSILHDSCQYVCLTTDTWTSIQRVNYMCLNAHWIDDKWKLKKRILNFCPISSHRGKDLGKAVESCLVDWGIYKIFTITVDNASSNDAMIAYFKRRFNHLKGTILEGKYLHMRCIAHIINLIVNDGLKEVENPYHV